uniref:Uncharacterized protein n=1 Tax=Anguilla anguilla TaxID=7936 RepID=A0A0E9RJW3_ANGAN
MVRILSLTVSTLENIFLPNVSLNYKIFSPFCYA